MKKTWQKPFGVFAIIFSIGLIVTGFFLSQHTIAAKEALINQSAAFEDLTVELNKLTLTNAESKRSENGIGRYGINYELATKLPQPLQTPYLWLDYLYTSPYTIDNELWHVTLQGRCIYRQKPDTDDYHRNFYENIDILVVDSSGVNYWSNRGSRREIDSLAMEFTIRDDHFPIERLQEGFTVLVQNKKNGEELSFRVEYEDFESQEYNDILNRKLPSFLQ